MRIRSLLIFLLRKMRGPVP